ncbi:MAG: hypothetical protein ACHQ53_10915 [Polyangiales bacterium]
MALPVDATVKPLGASPLASGGALRFCLRHERTLLWALLSAAMLTRFALAAGSPTPFGYIYDFYPVAVRFVYDHHALPPPSACWICAHPPLFWIVGAPFYALGMFVSHGDRLVAQRALCGLPLLCDVVTVLYTYRLLRLYRQRGLFLVLGTALCASFPCLAISSHAPESDILLTALMVAGLYHLARIHVERPSGVADAAWLGVLCGLAALTKYSGLLLALTAAAVLLGQWLGGRTRAHTVRQAGLACGLFLATAGSHYLYNLTVRHELLVANGSARDGFRVLGLADRARNFHLYDFASLKLDAALALFERHDRLKLSDEPVYGSVWTTLHAMAWTDMSMFSVHERHGDPSLPYPTRHVSLALIRLVLLLGLVPTALACIGGGLSAYRKRLWPLSFFAASSFLTYVWWFLAQDSWALKTKYLLFLLPVYVLFALVGLRGLLRLRGVLGQAVANGAVALLLALVLSSITYLLSFALA